MSDDDSVAVAEFIRTKGITRCPTAFVLPTQALLGAADRAALEEHAATRVKRHPELTPWRHQELTPLALMAMPPLTERVVVSGRFSKSR